MNPHHIPPIDCREDGHVHTELCNHARGTMEEYVLAAIDKGLKTIVFLEHLEVGINYFERTWLTPDLFERYREEGEKLRRRYQDRIAVRLGVEVGYHPAAVAEINAFLKRTPWDRIGLSYHFLAAEDGTHLNLLSRQQANLDAFTRFGVERAVDAYLAGLEEAVERIDAHVLCHLDAPLRHHPDLVFTPAHHRRIERIVKAAVRRGLALEINTSGFRHARKAPYPAPWMIRYALDRGMTLVAGSDAHQPRDVGRYFDRLPGYLARL